MRWLLIGLLVSLGALLLAAAGAARHIWIQHSRPHGESLKAAEAHEETDFEMEH